MSAVVGSIVAIVRETKRKQRSSSIEFESGRKRSVGKSGDGHALLGEAYVGLGALVQSDFRTGGILVTKSHDLNLSCIHAPSRSEINSSVISEDAIVNSSVHGCMGRCKGLARRS